MASDDQHDFDDGFPTPPPRNAGNLPLKTILLAAGVAALHIEDQVWPKRCGHMRGKSVVSMEEHVAKIRAAVDVVLAA